MYTSAFGLMTRGSRIIRRPTPPQLEDARNKHKEVQKLIEAIEPGIPSMATIDEAAAPTV